ncbi:MAG: metallophosphoesterase [Roseburia sp.]|nr:metallophosphoesterase [Roseburia sp.]
MIKFTVFGDLHYDEVPDGSRRIEELLAGMKETKPDFIVSLGDLCRPVDENEEIVLDKFRIIGVPIYHTIGNHETDECSLEDALRFLSLKNSYYSFEYEDIKFIVMNSCYFSKEGKEQPYYKRNYKAESSVYPIIPSEEMKWLENELSDNKRYVIFSHHSLINEFRDRGIFNRKEIRELFKEKKILLCMNGHDHGDEVSMLEDVPYFTVNSAAYMWCGAQISSSEKLREKYANLHGMLMYKQAFCVNVEIDDDEIRIIGMEGEYLSVTPEDVELYDYRWNGVSVKPQTSSCVIKLSK